MKKLHFTFLLFFLWTCGGGGGSSPTEPVEPTYIVNLVSLGGAAQKGPFNNGTIINIAELNNTLNPTGRNFTSQIVDNSGKFSVSNVQMDFPYAEIRASGFYFDEVGNAVSSAQLVLSGLSNLTGKTSMNVNVLSNLEMNRIKYLIANNSLTFAQAKIQAQEEVLAIFGYSRSGVAESELLDITQSGVGNAKLLSISAILQGNRSVGELSELLANISTDITNDGVINDASISQLLLQSAYSLNLQEIRTNLEGRYASLGISVNIPDFESEVNNFYKPPVANDMSLSVDEDTTINITLDASDPEGESLTFSTVEVNNATISISGNTATYVPDAQFNGTDTFTYLANDGSFNSNVATVTITVGAIDDEPNTNDISTTTDEDVSVVMNLTADEFDGESYSFNIISDPSNGTATLSGTQVTYTPNQDWNGTDTFTFEATDDRTARTNVATATIVVNPINDAPIANDVLTQTNENLNNLDDIEVNVTYDADNDILIGNTKGVILHNTSSLDITLDGTDVDGDNLSYNVIATNNGAVTISGAIATYEPTQDWNGTDTFTYQANDGSLDSNVATVTITVNSVNDAPTSADEGIITIEDNPVRTGFSSSDIDGDVLTYIVVSQPSNGTVTIDSSNNEPGLYTPNTNFNGTDTFTYKANDGDLDSNVATVTVTVTAVNDAPTTDDIATTIDENRTASRSTGITLLGTDVENDALTYSIVTGPSNGTASVSGATLTYTANQDYNGTDTITYKANDGSLDSNTSTVTVTITPVDDAPVVDAQTLNTNEDTAVSVTLTATDIEGDSIEFAIDTAPSNGTLNPNTASWFDGQFDYTPNQDFNGTDTILVKAKANGSQSVSVNITINIAAVNDAPTTDDIATTIDENRTASRSTGITLLGTDVENDALTYSIVTGPSNGTASISGSTLTYDANQDYNGTETITYKANDGTVDSNTSTITITITPVNDTPVVTGGGTGQVDTQAIKFSGTGSYLEVPSNGTGSELEFSAAAWIKVTSQPSQPSGGTIIARRNYDGSERTHFHFWVGNNMNLSFMTNDRNVNTFQISTADNSITLNQWHYVAYTFDNGTSTFYIDGLPVSHSDSGSVSGNTNQLYSYDHWINIGAVHRTGGQSTFDFFTGEMNELTIWDDPLTQTDITTLYNDGKYYAADDLGKDLNGWWQFESSFLVDSSGTWGDASLIVGGGSVTTIDTNLSPSTTSASITTNEDTAGTIDLSSFASDVDGDDLTYIIVTDVDTTNGTTALSGSTVTYTPAANYNGTDSFTWKANDGTVDSATGTVNITITAVNDAPTTNDVATTINETRTNNLSSITLDGSDVDGDALTYSIVTGPSNGTASVSGSTLTYTANQDYNGTDTITYKANDGTVDSNTSTVTVTITPVNDDPVVNSGSSLSLDGTDDYAEISAQENNINLSNSSFTLSAWIVLNGEDPITNAATIMSTGIGSTNNGLYFMIEGGDLELSFYGNSVETDVLGIEDDNLWHHVAGTYDVATGERKLYLDGTLRGSDTSSSAFLSSNTNFTIGTTAWNYVDDFEGFIDEAAVWNSALTASQIASLANDSKNPLEIDTSNLSAYWEFESNSGNSNIITDLSLNSNNLENNATLVTNGTAINTSVLEDVSVSIQLYVNDVDGDNLTYSIETDATNGSTSLSGNVVTYTPSANYNGTDSFTYKANDGTSDSAIGTVNITVTAVNDAPVTSDVASTIDENRTASRLVGITLLGTDVENDALTYSIVTGPSNGTASVSGATLTYTANQDYNGTDTITYKANDGSLDSNTSTVTVTITPVNDTPVVSGSGNLSMKFDASLVESGNTNDGYVQFPANTFNFGGEWTMSFWYKDGGVTTGTQRIFSRGYTESDPHEGSAGNAAIGIGFLNGGSFARNLEFHAREGSGEAAYSSSTINDSDGWQHYVIVRNNGSMDLYINSSLDGFYNPIGSIVDNDYETTDFINRIGSGALALDDNGLITGLIDDFAIWDNSLNTSQISSLYNGGNGGVDPSTVLNEVVLYYSFDGETISGTTISDQSGNGNDATFTNVQGALTTSSDVPFGTGGTTGDSVTITTDEDTATTIDLSTYASDVDGDVLTYSIVTDVDTTNGTTALSGSTVTYTPAANYNGTDSFTYKVNDGIVDSATGTVNITITAVNDAPTTDDIATTINENRMASRSTGITLQGSDIDGDALTYSIVTGPSNGTASVSGSTLTYTANQDYNGTDTITYKANDGTVDSNTSTVTVTITPVNDTPVVTGGVDDNSTDYSFDISSNDGYGSFDIDYSAFDVNTSNPGSGATPASQFGLANVSVSTWVRFTDFDHVTNTGSQRNYLWSDKTGNNSNGENHDFGIQVKEDEIHYYWNANGDEQITASYNFSVDTWYHIMVVNEHGMQVRTGVNQPGGSTSENNGHRLYINGAFVASAKYAGSQMFNDTGFYLAADASGDGTLGVNGFVDGFAIWDDWLTASEIASVTSLGRNHDLTSNSDNYASSSNLRTFYTFDSETNNVVSDSAGNGQSLTLNSNGAVDTVNNYSALFASGSRSYIQLPEIDSNLGTANSSATFSMWFKPTSTPVYSVLLHSTVSAGSSHQGIYGRVGFTEGRMKVYHRNGIDDHEPSGTTDFSNSTDWNHFVYVIDGTNSELRGYANGNLEFTRSYDASNSYYDSARQWEIGDISFGASNHNFEGYMDDVAIWDTALSATQISNLYNNGDMVAANNFSNTNLKAYYDFESGSTNDKSGNGKHPTSTSNVTVVDENGAGSAGGSYSINVSTDEDTAGTIDLSSFASDIDGDNLTYSIVSDVSNGSTSLSGSTVTYTPTANYSGLDSFTWKANDGTVDSATGTVSITVTAVNDAPTSSDETINLTYESDNTYSVTLPAGSDIEGDDITYITVSTDDLHGSFSHDGSSQTGTFTSNANLTGAGGTLTYKVNDGTSDSNISTVTLIVDSGNVTADDTNNQSLDFSGNDTYVTLPEIDLGLGTANSAMTISLWVKDANNEGTIIQSNAGWVSGNASQSVDFGRVNTWDGEFAFGLRDVANSIQIEPSATATVTLSDWNHIVYVFGSGENKMFINGVESAFDRASSYTSTHDFYNANRVWELGRNRDSSDDSTFNNFTGLLDDVAIWNVELTSTQVSSLYNNGDMLTANNVSPDNLKAYYNMEGSGSSITDQSGNYKDGTITNATFSSETVGSNRFYAIFAGNDNSEIDLPEISTNLGAANTGLTASVWFKQSSSPGTYGVLFHSTVSGGNGTNYAPRLGVNSGGNVDFYHISQNGDNNSGTGTESTNYNEWNHAVFRADGDGEITVWVNGVLDMTESYDHTLSFVNDSRLWQIGNWDPRGGNQGGHHAFTGNIDEFAIWDTSLSDSEIATLYNSGNGLLQTPEAALSIQSTNLKGFYTFESEDVNDTSGNSKDGTNEGVTFGSH